MPKLPSRECWLWAGDFAGLIALRWHAGTGALPPCVNRHVFYTVVPWRRNRGYATEALRLVRPVAHAVGLRWIEVGCSTENAAKRRVILKNGGRLLYVRPDPGTPDGMVEIYRVEMAASR